MYRSLDPGEDRAGRGLDAIPRFLCRLLGRREPAQMNWKQYCIALLTFNVALFVLTFGLLYAQQHLPLNPDNKGSLGALGYKDTAGVEHKDADTGVVFNTVCSFVTNTNLQHYSGEQHLSYFSQLGGIVWLMFVTPAVGLAVMLAVMRGLRGDKHLGDFYLDMMRSLVFVFIPVARGHRAVPRRERHADDLRWRRFGQDGRRRGDQDGDADDRAGAGGRAGGDQAGRDQRRRILRPELGPPVREPDALDQPDLDRRHRAAAHGVDRDGRPDDQGQAARRGDLRRHARPHGGRGHGGHLGGNQALGRDRATGPGRARTTTWKARRSGSAPSPRRPGPP